MTYLYLNIALPNTVLIASPIIYYSDNFLKVDVYYGELKVQSTEQDKAYDVMTFFSTL